MSKAQIIRGYGLPKTEGSGKYPFAELEVGDAFKFPGATQGRLSSAACKHAEKYGGKFAVRKTGNDNEYVVIRIA